MGEPSQFPDHGSGGSQRELQPLHLVLCVICCPLTPLSSACVTTPDSGDEDMLEIAELFQATVPANHYSFSQRSLDTSNTWHKVEPSSLLQDVEVGNSC